MSSRTRTVAPIPEPDRVLFLGLLALFLLGVWGVLLQAQNPGLTTDDSGEFVAASWVLGIPHPPGYPLVTLAGRMASWLPLGTPAFRFNLLAAFFAVLSLGLAAILLDRLVRETVPGAGAVLRSLWTGSFLLSLLSARCVFAQCFTAKGAVYTSTMALALGLLLLWERKDRGREGSRLALAGFLWSAGLANHWQTTLLFAFFLGLWIFRRPPGAAASVRMAAFGVLGVSCYLYHPLRAVANPMLDWGHPDGLRRFLWVLTRRLSADSEPWLRDLSTYGIFARETRDVLIGDVWPGLAVLAVIGVIRMGRSVRPRLIAWLTLAVPVVLGVLVMPRPGTQYLLNVYLLPVMAVLVLLAAAGWIGMFFRDTVRAGPAWTWTLTLLLVLINAVWLQRTFRSEDRSRYFLQEDYGTNLLQGLPRGAFLLGEGDVNVFPFLYQRACRGARPDLAMTPLAFLHHDWGWEQTVRQRPGYAEASPTNILERLKVIRSDGGPRQGSDPSPGSRDLFVTLDVPMLTSAFPGLQEDFRPMGLVRGVTSRKAEPRRLEAWLAAVEWRQRWRGEIPDPVDMERGAMDRGILERIADSRVLPADYFLQAGMTGAARPRYDQALRVDPSHARAYANLALLEGREGRWELAQALCERGIAEAGPSPVLYFNLGRALTLGGDREGARAAYEEALRLRPEWDAAIEEIRRMHEGGTLGARKGTAASRAGEYRRLAWAFRREGCVLLASMAERLARSLAPGEEGR